MELSQRPAAASGRRVARGMGERPLRGYQLLLAWTVWAIVAQLAFGVCIVIVSTRWTQLQAPTPDIRTGLARLGLSTDAYAVWSITLEIAFRLALFGAAALIVFRKSNGRVALLVALTLVALGASYGPEIAIAMPPGWKTVGDLMAAFGFTTIWLLFYLFPDGHFVPPWTRWLAASFVAAQVFRELARRFPSLPLDYANLPPVFGVAFIVGLLGSCVFAQIYRYRRVSGSVQRQQTKWVVFGLVVALSVASLFDLFSLFYPAHAQAGSLYGVVRDAVFRLSLAFMAGSIAVAVLRYRLWDIDPIINRTLVYGALVASVVGIYVVVVGYLGALFQARGSMVISLLATSLVAVLFQPLHGRLQRAVNRLMYGERDDPYAVITRLGQRVEATITPDAVLPTIVETVRETLKLPYVGIALVHREGGRSLDTTGDRLAPPDDAFTVVAQSGAPVADPLRLPLVYQGERIGHLVVGPRATGESFSMADHRLLATLARQTGVAAHAWRLTADLQRSRQHLVTAREEERRRLRRDLHDGLGPQLAMQTMQLEAARDLLLSDPARTSTLLNDLIGQSQAAIADIRRLVYALRPPALDELGLISALREQALHYQDTTLRVTIDAPEHLPPLPAAVEVAAYRIVQEALSNVVRHAHARACTIRLGLDDALWLAVSDDGRGIPESRRAGVGMHSMRERAAELGGTCVIEPGAEGGTRVSARLPLSMAEP